MIKNSKTFITGIIMGLADLVPGVSGGTIAFMSGIYEKLIESLSSVTWETFNDLLSGHFKKFWKAINGTFLFTLFGGIAVSILLGSRGIHWLLENYPTYMAMFFVGLIICSAFFLYKNIKTESDLGTLRNIAFVGLGILCGLLITLGTSASIPLTGPGFILAGILGSLAMLLPGISGSYILLIIGMYGPIITAVSNFSEGLTNGNTAVVLQMLPILISVGVGIIIGILSMSKLLKWFLKKWHIQTVLLLLGIMIGALPAILPAQHMIIAGPIGSLLSFIGGGFIIGLFFWKK